MSRKGLICQKRLKEKIKTLGNYNNTCKKSCWKYWIVSLIPKDILYGEFASGRRTAGHPKLCYRDVCKFLGELLQATVKVEKHPKTRTLRQGKKNWLTQQQTSGQTERSAATLTDQRPHTDTTCVIETVTPALVSSATSNTVLGKQLARKARMYYPWSTMTDGGLLSLRHINHYNYFIKDTFWFQNKSGVRFYCEGGH